MEFIIKLDRFLIILLIASIVAILTRRLKVPYSVGLVFESQTIAERRMAVYRHISQLRIPKSSGGGASTTEEQTEAGIQQGKEE